MTNGDKIRNMTDDGLAEFLVSADADACAHCEYHYDDFGCRLDNPCVTPLAYQILKDWLSETVSERSENRELKIKSPNGGFRGDLKCHRCGITCAFPPFVPCQRGKACTA